MGNEIPPAASAMLSIFELEHTDTLCDLCPRNARYHVYATGSDHYLCKRHTVSEMGAVVAKIEAARILG